MNSLVDPTWELKTLKYEVALMTDMYLSKRFFLPERLRHDNGVAFLQPHIHLLALDDVLQVHLEPGLLPCPVLALDRDRRLLGPLRQTPGPRDRQQQRDPLRQLG